MQRRHALGLTSDLGEAPANEKRGTVLDRRVADEAKLGLFAGAFAIEPRLGVGRRGTRLIRTPLAVEIRFLFAPAALFWWLLRPSLA